MVEYKMAKIKLKIVGSNQTTNIQSEDTVNAEKLWEIIRRVELTYPRDYYTFSIFLNGVKENDESRSLHDGDEVVLVPVFSGG
jgi:molybdopterin converting factor small subunit